MITIKQNWLEGKWATALDHPITCMNEAPWRITEMEITHEFGWSDGLEPKQIFILKLWIRGEGSCWRRADQCFIDDRQGVEDYLYIKGYKNDFSTEAVKTG